MKPNLMNYSEIIKVVNKDINNKLSGEKIIFSDSIIKINNKLVEQKRDLIITDQALYNFNNNSLKRRLPIKSIKGLTASKTSDEFVIHGEDSEYDYHYTYKNKRKIIQILAAVYYSTTSHKLNFALVKDNKLNEYVTVSKEKRKDKKISKFNDKFSLDIDVYLYGNLLRKNSIRTHKQNQSLISVMKAQKTELVFLNDTNSFKEQNKIKIENFRILGSLIDKSFYGKLYWTESIFNNNFYLMRVINYPEILELISDIEKVTTSFASNCISLTSADCIFKTQDKTFILNKFNPYFEGGYLFYHLKNSMTFNETKIRIISAQIINIIIYFHKNIEKHMNFSPENFILDKDGYINYLWFEIDQKLFIEKCRPKIIKPLEYIKINNDWYNLGVLMYELLLNLNPENFRDKDGKLKYPRFINISEEIKEFIEKLMSMKNKDDELSLEEIKKYKFFDGINFDDISNRKFDSEIKPMNLEMQRINNLGIVTDEHLDENEEKEKERYTLFNYDSEDSNEEKEY